MAKVLSGSSKIRVTIDGNSNDIEISNITPNY